MSRPININDLRPFANPTALAAIDRAEARRRAAFQFDGNLGDGISAAAGAVLGGASAGAGGSLGSGGQTGVGAGASGTLIPMRDVTIEVVGNPVSLLTALMPVAGVYQAATAIQKIGETLTKEGWNIAKVNQIGVAVGYGFRYQIVARVTDEYTDDDVWNNIRSHLSSILTVHDVKILKRGAAQYIDPSQKDAYKPGSNGFLDMLGLGLGVSTPVVIGGAVLLLVLLLRR